MNELSNEKILWFGNFGYNSLEVKEYLVNKKWDKEHTKQIYVSVC